MISNKQINSPVCENISLKHQNNGMCGTYTSSKDYVPKLNLTIEERKKYKDNTYSKCGSTYELYCVLNGKEEDFYL